MRPELALILGCGNPQPDASAIARTQELARQPLDWEEVARLARRHGLLPLLCRNLPLNGVTPPPEVAARLRPMLQGNALQATRLTWELREMLRDLAAQGLNVLAYKGPLLAQMLYGDTALRQYNDLDLLARRADVPAVARLLQKRGYDNLHNFSPKQEQLFLTKDCEYTFLHREQRFNLDLHWDFAPRFFALRLDVEDFWRRAQSISLEDDYCLTLSPEDTLLIMSVNAAKDFWSRLLLVCDMAQLIRQTPALDWPALWPRAVAARAQRMLGLSLWLARELLGLALPPFICQKLAADQALPELAEQIKQSLFGKEQIPAPVNTFLLPARALPNRMAQWEFHLRLALEPSPEDWAFVNLPESLNFLYYFTRPARLVRKYILGR